MQLKKIIIGSEAKEDLYYVNSIDAIAGKGLEGDRYFFGNGTFNRPQFDQNVRGCIYGNIVFSIDFASWGSEGYVHVA
jgi:hypothetical protein